RVIRAIGTAFSGIAAPFADMSDKLDLQLTYAGRPYGGIAGREFLAAVVVISLMVGGALGLVFALMTLAQTGSAGAALGAALRWTLLMGPVVAIYLISDIRGTASRNSEDIEREFPFFLDLAVLVVQAGGTPRKALSKYVEASPGTPLAREIAITAKDADATSFDDALHRMIDRVQATSVKTILKNLAQGEKTSGEAEQFYTDQAEELRYLREEMANRTAERLKTNIVFPVFLLMTGVIIAALAPTIVSIRSQGFF
ncbi:MAG: type II secretion system F family protein, partial [Pseudomonadota bacterium]